jgi:hypothetical protein
MRFMIIVKASPESESGEAAGTLADPALLDAMAKYHEELAQAGVLLDALGLHPSRQGWRVRFHQGGRSVLDGPFTEAKALIAGCTLIEVRSREEALEWSRRFPAPHGLLVDGEIEVRQVHEWDEPGPPGSFQGIAGVRK